jgi:hypothetical protein
MIYYNLTKEQAEQVLLWEDEGLSWRRIAEEGAKSWPELGIVSGVQQEGRELIHSSLYAMGRFK